MVIHSPENRCYHTAIWGWFPASNSHHSSDGKRREVTTIHPTFWSHSIPPSIIAYLYNINPQKDRKVKYHCDEFPWDSHHLQCKASVASTPKVPHLQSPAPQSPVKPARLLSPRTRLPAPRFSHRQGQCQDVGNTWNYQRLGDFMGWF